MCVGDGSSNLIIGSVLAVVGNLCISISFQVQKKAHNDNKDFNAQMRQKLHSNVDERPYTKLPLWWFGLLLMASGEIGNFLAYGYAPATLVAPLGAVSVIANAISSHLLLHEPFLVRVIVGLALALAGAVAIVICAPQSCSDITEAILKDDIGKIPFLVFLGAVVLAFLIIRFRVSEDLKNRYVIFNVMLCALLGSITVMCAKGISTAFRSAIAGDPSWFRSWLVYIFIVLVVPSIVFQMQFLNRAMTTFGASEVVPVYYVTFNIMSISAGIALYHEYTFRSPIEIAFFVLGVLATFFGIFLISHKKASAEALEISQGHLEYQELEEKKERAASGSGKDRASSIEGLSF